MFVLVKIQVLKNLFSGLYLMWEIFIRADFGPIEYAVAVFGLSYEFLNQL